MNTNYITSVLNDVHTSVSVALHQTARAQNALADYTQWVVENFNEMHKANVAQSERIAQLEAEVALLRRWVHGPDTTND